MNFKIGDSIDNYDDLRKLPEGTVLTARSNLTSGDRILETRNGVLGLWSGDKNRLTPLCRGETGKFDGILHYIIKALPPETEGTADEFEAFEMKVIEIATRYATKCRDVVDDALEELEELGLFRIQKRQVTFTVALDVELPRSIEPNGFNSTPAVFQDLEENLHDAVKEALVAEAKLHGISVENITVK